MTLCSSAFAQSSVTLYGIVDGGIVYQSKTLGANGANGANGGKLLAFTDSGQVPSQFGFSGMEDLGGGLISEFKLESGINVGNGGYNDSNGNFFGRQAYVGLKGRGGELKAGLQFSPFFITLFALDPRGLSQFGSGLPVYLNHVAATGIFTPNSVSYTTPIFAGLQGSALISLGGVAGSFASGRQYSLSVNYAWQGLDIAAALFDSNAGGTVQTVPPSTVEFEGRMIGASYSFGKLTAKASFTSFKVAESGTNDNVYAGGVDCAVSPVVSVNAGVWHISNRNNSSGHSLMGSAGVTYSLSKATAIYVQSGVVNNHGTSTFGLEVGDAPASLSAPKGTTFGADIGVRHFF
ncbi:porin [Paraburkholderia dipogonis]|uniref:Porin n=1 Tax=Paraburkholderia dipogonis TaxID=1211383 RepID=A0A4Y8MI04_9BURK|nr:porin [Paraburkholderia dipogonis]TFE37014.1 porin [Paraburkholderia dipogonis]